VAGVESEQPRGGLAQARFACPVHPRESLVPDEVVQDGGFDRRGRRNEVGQFEDVHKQAQHGQLHTYSDPADEVELQPSNRDGLRPRTHGRRSSLNSKRVWRTAAQISIAPIPMIPITPPISNKRNCRPNRFAIGPRMYSAILPIQSRTRSSVGPKLQNER